MRIFTTLTVSISILATTLFTGCASSFIDVKEGADKISVKEASQVSKCDSKGRVTSSVLSKVLFVDRSQEGVEENLLQMAKNAAIDDGANTIVKGESKKFGERTFLLYNCR